MEAGKGKFRDNFYSMTMRLYSVFAEFDRGVVP
jgi:hypothetical protein